jgi:arylsulfatase A-like enzyme
MGQGLTVINGEITMGKPFKGKINIDVRDSVPDWEPYKEPIAQKDAANVLFIVWDDVGFGAFNSFGGSIETPTMDRLANNGLRYTQFHTTALCSPTRATLITGRNHTTVGMACITEATTGFPGSNGRIPPETANLAEVLVERGYNTFAVGKWHLTPEEEGTTASSKRNWPLNRGFERFYGFLGGETSQWYPDLVYDNHVVEQPYLPKDGYHLSKDLVDMAIRFVRDSKQIAPSKPFFLYFCPGAGHAPHHVPKEWADKYKGKFDMGYELYREMTIERQKEMGIVPPNTDLSPINPMVDEVSAKGTKWPELDTIPAWDKLSSEERGLFNRMAEVYAGFVSYTDHEIGRLIDYLEEAGQLDNTLVVVLSDNGASGEGGPYGSVNENLFFNGMPDKLEDNLKMMDKLGGEDTYNHYPAGWAEAFCTPFKMYKRYAAWSGGTCDPLIISWPKGINGRGVRHQYHHVVDIVPTILDCLSIEMPDSVKGYSQKPLEGVSIRNSFEDEGAPTSKTTQYFNMLGSRGIWHEGWKASTVHPTIAGWGNYAKDRWELFHIDEDRAEVNDLANKYPEKLTELIQQWFVEAGKTNGLPLEDRMPLEVMMTPRPQPAEDRKRYVYYPDTEGIPESVAPNIRNRSFKVGALLDIPSSGAEGLIFQQGSKFGGHAMYIKDGKLTYVYNFLGMKIQTITSKEKVPSGRNVIVAATFDKDESGPRGIPHGNLSLFVNEKKVGEGTIQTQPGKFGLGGSLFVGRRSGSEISPDFPDERPWKFTGTINRVVIDLSGESYQDIEKEAQRALRTM